MKVNKWFYVLMVIAVICLIMLVCINTGAEQREQEEQGEAILIDQPLEVQDRYEADPPTYELTVVDIDEQNYYDSLEMLAICVEAEAGNQDLYGKRLVTDVILNRVDSDRFPNSINEVISQPYQFETYWNGAMDRVEEPSEDTFKAVRMELESRTDSKILFFTYEGYNKYCEPAYKHGDHYFGY